MAALLTALYSSLFTVKASLRSNLDESVATFQGICLLS